VKENILKAQIREGRGKGAARRLRAQGFVPGVVYGEGDDSIALSLSHYDFAKMITKAGSSSMLVDLEIEGVGTKKVLIKDLQTDPVLSNIISVDFIAINMDKEITTSVPMSLVGIPDGVTNFGGVLQTIRREIEISCLPGSIPEKVEFDVSEMGIGDTIHYEDIPAEGFTVISNPKVSICTIVAPTVVKETVEAAEGEEGEEGAEGAEEGAVAPAEGEEGKQPEVITEKKDEKK
jgi:large subunit ribosomal protein L25